MILNQTISYDEEYIFFYNFGVPLRGLKTFSLFNDTLTGETINRYFQKDFRFALNGFRFSDWKTLDLTNLIADIQGGIGNDIEIKNDLRIEMRYKRIGSDTTGTLTLNTVNIDGDWNLAYLQTLDFENTIFGDLAFTDEYWNKVMVNLMNKLYEEGVVPKYIERQDDNHLDDDYITFFKTLAYWYALPIALANRDITELDQHEDLFVPYLLQRGLFLCGEEDITVLQNLAQNIYDQVRRRGTGLIHKPDGDHLNPVQYPIHGELLRMICFEIEHDDYLWEYTRGGWYVNTNSPTSNSMMGHLQLNKMPFNTEDITDLSVTFWDTTTNCLLAVDGIKNIVDMSVGATLKTLPIKASTNIPYVIQFLFRTPTEQPNLEVNLSAVDSGGFSKDFKDITTGLVLNTLGTGVTGLIGTEYYIFKAIIWNWNEPPQSLQDGYNDFLGRHVRFGSPDIERLQLEIKHIGGAGQLYIWDLKMYPLLNPNNPVFINGNDQNSIWLKNRNPLNSDKKLIRDITQYMIPVNSGLNVNRL